MQPSLMSELVPEEVRSRLSFDVVYTYQIDFVSSMPEGSCCDGC